jgi:rod shape-determining protein MreC
MTVVDIRHRAGYLFLAVSLAEVLLISAQVNSRSGVPVLEEATFGVFSQVQQAIADGFSGIDRLWSGYVALRGVTRQNDTLRQELASAQVALQEQRALADRARSLEQLLALRDRSALQTVAAEIIASGASPEFRTLTIDKGARQGLKADMAVIAPAGVVGRIVIPSAQAAKVQLLVDRNAAAGALIERSRAQGIVVGGGDDPMQLEYVAETADVVVGDLVVTSGIDGIYPKGYAIGRVQAIERTGTSYKRITVAPAVDFSSLEDVLVVLTPPPAREAEGAGE